MARFYRTSGVVPEDYMYKIDSPLMEQVLLSNDQGISDLLNQSDKLDALKNFNHIPGVDDTIAQREQKNINDQVDTITSNIQNDYANWKKQINPIRNLGKAISENYTTGVISKLQQNYNLMKKNFDDIDTQVALYNKTGGVDKDGHPVGINPIKAQLAKKYVLNNYKGAFDSNNNYNAFQPIPLMNDIDIGKLLDNEVSKIKTDKNDIEMTKLTGPNGAYFDDVTNSWQGVPQDKILSVAMNRIMSDPSILANLRQSQEIGYINNAFKTNQDGSLGNLIMPFTSIADNQATPQEQANINTQQNQINILKRKNPAQAEQAQNELNKYIQGIQSRTKLSWNPQSYLTPFLQDVLNKYGGATTSYKEKLSNNSYANMLYEQGQQNWRQNRQFQHDDYKQNQAFENAKVLAGINHNFRLDEIQAKLNAANKKAGSKKSNSASIISNTTISPYGYLATSPEDVDKNINSLVMQNGQDIMGLYKERDAAKASGDNDMANFISNQISSKMSEQFNLNSRIDKAKQDAINKIVPKTDMDLYNDKDNVKQKYYDLRKNIGYGPLSQEALLNSKEGQNYIKVINYDRAIDKQYKDNLYQATKSASANTTVVGTTEANDDFLKQSIASDPSSYKVVDPKTGLTLNFLESGKVDPQSLKDFDISGVSPGVGNDFSSVNIYGTIKGKNVMLVPTGPTANIVKNHLIEDWTNSGDAGVKQLVSIWGSPYFNAVNNATTDIWQNDHNPNQLGEAHHINITLPNGNAQLSITKLGENQGYKVDIKTPNGWKAIHNIDDKGNNIGDYFSNSAEIVKILNMADSFQQKQNNKK